MILRVVQILVSLTIALSISTKYDKFYTNFYTSATFGSSNYIYTYFPQGGSSYFVSPFFISTSSCFSAINQINVSANDNFYYQNTFVSVSSNNAFRITHIHQATNTYITSVRVSFFAFDYNYPGFIIYQQYSTRNSYFKVVSSGYFYSSGSTYSSNSLDVNDKVVHFLYYFQAGNPFYSGLDAQSNLYFSSNAFYISYSGYINANYGNYFHKILVIKSNLLKNNYNVVVDVGYISGTGTGASPSFSTINLEQKYIKGNLMTAINSFKIQKTTSNFYINGNGNLTFFGSYDFINASYINVRVTPCNNPLPLLVVTTQVCVATCPIKFFTNNYDQTCEPCYYKCATCTNANDCTTCSATNYRTQTGTQCLCSSGYFQNSVAICPPCISNCVNCNNGYDCLQCTSSTLAITYFTIEYQVNFVLSSTKICLPCSSIMSFCISCTAYNICTSCAIVNFTVSPTKNSCPCNNVAGYWLNGSNCTLCKDLILGCLTCDSSNICNNCDSSKKFVINAGRCVCQIGYNLFNGFCCHYSCSTCEAPNLCSSCNSISQRYFQSKQCKCNDKYYDNNIQVCDQCMYLCRTCNTGTTCLTCESSNNLTLKNSQCVCNSNYVLITNYCRYCPQVISHCVTCNDKDSCKTCFSPNYTLSSDTSSCDCSISLQYFLKINTNECHFCSDLIYNCINCAGSTTCLLCVSNFTVSGDSTMCICDTLNNYYPVGNICPHCFDLLVGCEVCSSNNTCNKCFDTNYTMGYGNLSCDCSEQTQYFDWQGKCPFCRDIIIGCTDCDNNQTCITCDTTGFFRLQGSRCVCIDGYYLSGVVCLKCQVSCLTCVNTATYCLTCNNTALRLFDNNNCICREHFSDCKTSGNCLCSNHSCSFLNNINIQIQELIKNPQKNSLSYTISIFPALIQFDNFDFMQIFSIGLPSNTQMEYSYNKGILKIQVDYFSNMQGNWTNITYDINQTGYWYFQLAPRSQISYQIAPTNNLASNQYSQQIYNKKTELQFIVHITALIGLLVYIIGLFSNNIVSSQMIAVIQIAYVGLFIVSFSDPIILSLNKLSFSHGFNNVVSTTQQKLSSQVFLTGYTSSTISNLNLMMILLLIPPILSIIFFIIHRKSTKYRIKMQKYSKLSLGQGMITTVLFILYNYSCSLVTIIFSDYKLIQFYISVVELLLITGVLGIMLWLFFTKNKTWIGQYKQSFNWNDFSELYYLYPIGQRFFIAIILTAGNKTFISGIVAIIILIGGVVLVAWKKPFIHGFQNFRSILMNIYAIIILGLYTAIRIQGPSSGESIFTYFPYIIFGVVALNIFTGLLFIIIHFIINLKNLKNNQACDAQQIVDAQLRLDVNRNVQKMLKDAKSNNLNSKLLKGPKKVKVSNTPFYEAIQHTAIQYQRNERQTVDKRRLFSEQVQA